MKKTILGSLLLGLVLLSISPLNVQASSGSTAGDIAFTEDEDPTGPVDPTDPTQPGDPDDNDNKETNNPGPLSLDIVPESFDFGTDKVSVKEKIYTANPTENPQYLQVTDNRTTANGWTVKVSRTEFINGSDELAGSILTIPAGTMRNTQTAAADPTGLTGNEAEMASGSEYTVFEAADQADTGKLQSTKYWAGDEVTLSVPGMTAKAGSYSATINWTLAATATP